MSWKIHKHLQEILASEQGYTRHAFGGRVPFALAYPNVYYVGMSNLGFHIIYDILNRRSDTLCERFFLPDALDFKEYERTGTPLLSLESQTPLNRFALVGFALSFEMDYFYLLKMLALGQVPLFNHERGEQDPIVLAGGPCATFNPEPLHCFVDAFIIGEGEEIMTALMNAYQEAKQVGKSRQEVLAALAQVPGVYVPSLYVHSFDETGRLTHIQPMPPAPAHVQRQWVRDLDAFPAHTTVVTEHTEFNMYLIETARGCGRHCRFCMAGYCFRRPRDRSLEILKREVLAAKAFGKRIGLMGAAISDYPQIDELCRFILAQDLPLSVASFRADSVTEELMHALAASGLRTVTLAPEAGSVKLRQVINKGIEEKHLFQALAMGARAGIRNYRLYIMIGLPFEEDADIDAIADLALRLADQIKTYGKGGNLTLSVNPFIPKPFTPFQWLPMAEVKVVERRLKQLRKALAKRKDIRLIAESPKEAAVQAILARGDRRLSKAIHEAHQRGGARAFLKAMKAVGLDAKQELYRLRDVDEILPWDVLQMGFSKAYLHAELKRAIAGKPTQPCFANCHRCGVC